MRKPVVGVSNQFKHIPGCITAEDKINLRLEISNLGSRVIVLFTM